MSNYTCHYAPWNIFKRISWFLLFVSVTSGCSNIREQEFSLSRQAYSFQPYSATQMTDTLASIQPISDFTVTIPVEYQFPPIVWHQAQFDELVSTIAADEITQGAKPFTLVWSASCNEVNFGPQEFSITYYRFGMAQGKGLRIETNVWASPRHGLIKRMVTGFSPPQDLYSASTGDLKAVLPAETLLALAEKSGGQKFRESLSDNCKVSGSFGDIAYTSTDGKTALRLIFDVKTGELLKTQLFPTPTS